MSIASIATPSVHFHRFSVAPMLDWTDRHCRYFHRLLSQRALLYSEMVTTGAILHGDRQRHLQCHVAEQPLVLQLGGSDSQDLAACAQAAVDFGYQAVNLNVGCPSDRVQNGRFGACLMADPQLVAACVAAMRAAVSLPVTVKCRIGIDDRDSYPELVAFVETVAQAGCDTFIVHARKAWLSGLSPKQNREIPPLRYEVVQQLKKDCPQLTIVMNGGITSLDAACALLETVDGVMIGREAYHNPYLLAEVDRRIYGDAAPQPSRHDIVLAMLPYIEQQLQSGLRLHTITRHMLGLFYGQNGARGWRRHLSDHANKPAANGQVLLDALEFVR